MWVEDLYCKACTVWGSMIIVEVSVKDRRRPMRYIQHEPAHRVTRWRGIYTCCSIRIYVTMQVLLQESINLVMRGYFDVCIYIFSLYKHRIRALLCTCVVVPPFPSSHLPLIPFILVASSGMLGFFASPTNIPPRPRPSTLLRPCSAPPIASSAG